MTLRSEDVGLNMLNIFSSCFKSIEPSFRQKMNIFDLQISKSRHFVLINTLHIIFLFLNSHHHLPLLPFKNLFSTKSIWFKPKRCISPFWPNSDETKSFTITSAVILPVPLSLSRRSCSLTLPAVVADTELLSGQVAVAVIRAATVVPAVWDVAGVSLPVLVTLTIHTTRDRVRCAASAVARTVVGTRVYPKGDTVMEGVMEVLQGYTEPKAPRSHDQMWLHKTRSPQLWDNVHATCK